MDVAVECAHVLRLALVRHAVAGCTEDHAAHDCFSFLVEAGRQAVLVVSDELSWGEVLRGEIYSFPGSIRRNLAN